MSAVLLDSDFGGQAIRALEQIEARCVIRIYHSGVIGNRDCVDFTSVKRKYIKCHATKITECYEVAVAVYGAGGFHGLNAGLHISDLDVDILRYHLSVGFCHECKALYAVGQRTHCKLPPEKSQHHLRRTPLR